MVDLNAKLNRFQNILLNTFKLKTMKNLYQVRELNSKFSFQATLLSLFMLLVSFTSIAQEQVTMSLEWLASTPTTADFQVRLTNTGALPVKFNSLIVRGTHAENIMTTGGTLSWAALNTNSNPSWNNWPNFTNVLPYKVDKKMLNYSSNVKFFDSETAPVIPTGEGIIVGSFRLTVTGGTWTPNVDFAFNFEPTAAVIGYVDGSKYVSSLATHGNNIICLVSGMSQAGVGSNSSSEFNVYPNPTNGKFNITLPLNIKANISVADAQGKIILEKNNLSNGSQMNLGNVAPGVYLVSISSENEVQTIRLVKN